ncbi:hypothetical protein [Phytohabitans aurantiacus]|uniref:Uncharacterized protein n=1 Tax=Phytohabitans aurantiacus TaxID=3016789 RepID=A0ABQ5RAE8_9ACTN|nr:hypothetical protein [Phytohabitans aurantiacus]GLI03198.1 hypothetical protein Pa4123_84760 [Phytohabitans aurantiacus]
MATFRLKEIAADELIVEATRVVTDGANIYFEDYVDGVWRISLSVPAENVERLRRSTGERQWIAIRPQPVTE